MIYKEMQIGIRVEMAGKISNVFSDFLKTDSVAALRMLEGKLFQSFGAATEKEQSPSVASVLTDRRWRSS